MSIITVQNLSKQFNASGPRKRALIGRFSNIFNIKLVKKPQPLNDVSFNLEEGESLGIIGKNGAGKTTLLKTIAGIYKMDAGTVNINGKALFLANMSNGMSARLTVKDNVFLVGAILGLTDSQIKKIFDKIIDFSGLNNFVDYKVHQLSSGMKQRIAFSTVMHCVEVINPDVILLDEVLTGGGGDEDFKERADEKVQEFLKSGKTMVIVSHSLSAIKKQCKHVIWMHHGKIKMHGKSKEVTDKYVEFIKNSKQSAI